MERVPSAREAYAEAMRLVRAELNNPLSAQARSPLLSILGKLKRLFENADKIMLI
jgi:hypothetical protein